MTEPTKSRINLSIEFEATAGTPRMSAEEIGVRIATFIAATMDAAGVHVNIDSAFLNYTAAYEADRFAAGQGNPDTDALN